MGGNIRNTDRGWLYRIWHNYVVRNVVLAVSLLVIVMFLANMLLNIFTRHNKHVEVPDFSEMTLEEVRAVSQDGGLRIEVNDSLYVASLEPGIVLDQKPAAGTDVKPGRRIYVTVNASQQKMIDVPYVAGYSLRQAKNMLETAGLEIERLVYVDDIATNNVLEQRVGNDIVEAEGTVRARMGSGVVLTVGCAPGTAPVLVPRVVGLSLREAKSRLWDAGLNVGTVSQDREIDRSRMRYAKVYAQQPERIDSAALGTPVAISISADSLVIADGLARSEQYVVERLREMAVRDSILRAQRMLEDSLRREGFVIDENSGWGPRQVEEDAILRSLQDYSGTISSDDGSEFFE